MKHRAGLRREPQLRRQFDRAGCLQRERRSDDLDDLAQLEPGRFDVRLGQEEHPEEPCRSLRYPV